MAQEKEEEKKIIIDQSWKEEAKREKEKLAAEEQIESKEQAKGGHGPLPKGDFPALVSMLATQSMFALGAINFEGEEEHPVDLDLAKYNIDMLEALEEKTKGNLAAEEQQMLSGALNQLRMLFVQISGKR